MELPLVNVSTCELRSVIRFFTAKNETAVNIHRNLVSVFGEECMSIQMVRRWRSWFLEGRQNVHDDERSGRPVTATDNAAVAAVRNVVEVDRRVTIDEIMIRLPPGIEIERSPIGKFMSDILNFLKVCARWVPRLHLENHKQQRMEAARAFLEMHQRDGDQLFSRIVTGDESWVHHSTPETKRQSMVWKKPEESAPKKAKVTISAGKVMAMENFKWEIFTHPPYSPELAPSDFHLFPALKLHLGGKHFANDDEVQAEETHWLRRQDTAWYNSGIKKLLQRSQRSAGKVLLTIFWDVDGPICLDFLSLRQRMNSDIYCDILVNKLKPGIRNKRRGKLSKGVLFFHDNARPHTSCKTVSTIIKLGFEVLEHPAYSPDLAPSDYFILGLLKKELKGKRFDSDEDVQKGVQYFFHTLPKSAYKEGIYKLPERWRRCIESQGLRTGTCTAADSGLGVQEGTCTATGPGLGVQE
ncbi:hypothetical protein LAZ67_2003605, partial [Cordylochernes scorpioides]